MTVPNLPMTMRKPSTAQTFSVIGIAASQIAFLLLHVHGFSEDGNISRTKDFVENDVEYLTFVPKRLFEDTTVLDLALFTAVIYIGFEVMSYLALHLGGWFKYVGLPIRGKHLDQLSMTDRTFIAINKLTAAPFLYYYLRFSYLSPHVVWSNVSVVNTIVALPLLYMVYDFVYTLLHLVLHIRVLYGWIHRHHHRQMAPSRGNVDAINVHPIEYILGECNHLLALYIVSHFITREVHFIVAFGFVALGGLLASINHTRYDIVWFGGLYDSKAHDVHHRIPQSNYGQYTMFWDKIFQTYRPYNPKDRVNPQVQIQFAEHKKNIGSSKLD
mmetsp:Transcript_20801/g.30793  ORF Transcript_20801/g.30793 Transcript_20801/m.30793 type:complete len:328 (-) Transcript_20801:26-1009(-)